MLVVGPYLLVFVIIALAIMWGVGEGLTGCGCAGFIIVPLFFVALFYLWVLLGNLGLWGGW